MGYHVSVTGGERTNRAGKPSLIDTTLGKPREPWKGASGRAQIVQPFKHQAATKSPVLFRKTEPSPAPESPKDAPNLHVTTVDSAPADTEPVADTREQFDTHEDPIKPTVPLKVGRNSPPRSIASPSSPNYPANLGLTSPTPQSTQRFIRFLHPLPRHPNHMKFCIQTRESSPILQRNL